MTIDPEALANKLAASTIRVALQRAGMFLTGWELLASDIVDGVRQFFETRPGVVDPHYQRDVLARHKSPLEASALWLVEQGALTFEQAERVCALRVHRNEIAHELAKLLVDPSHEINTKLLSEMATIIRAVGVFWGRIAVDVNGDFDGKEVKDEDIRSSASLLMAHLEAACESAVR